MLPEIYRAVSEYSRTGAHRNNMLPLNTRVKLSAEISYTCDMCDKKYIRKPALRKHIQVKHPSSVSQAQKSICIVDQPIPLPAVPLPDVSEEHTIDEHENSEEESSITLDEHSEVVEEVGPQQVDTNWQCSECVKTFEVESQFTEHMSQDHKEDRWQCNECEQIFTEENIKL